MNRMWTPNRRQVLGYAGLGAGAALGLPAWAAAVAAPAIREFTLRPRPGAAQLADAGTAKTAILGYGGKVPGPVLRVRQGDRLRVVLENGLDQPTSLHWHGLRVANAMDGVPYVTQQPVAPGARFVYEFEALDAGTYWYHPHINSNEQIGRGLAGALVVEEPAPPPVARDLVWVIDDWRLTKDGQISDDFKNMHDHSHQGRLGNTATVNGDGDPRISVRAGERIRLRLVNMANARIFGLALEGHDPWLVALDGQPVKPKRLGAGTLVLGPGQRADVIIDMTGTPGQSYRVIDGFYQRSRYVLANVVYDAAPPVATVAAPPPALPANPIAAPDLKGAERLSVVFEGGAMSPFLGRLMQGGEPADVAKVRERGLLWAINGKLAPPPGAGGIGAPLAVLKRGRSYIVEMTNETVFDHPIHLHGHTFKVLSRGGQPLAEPLFSDTVLMGPREKAEIAFVADNPGRWMFHCHILEHVAAGMTTYFSVA